MTHNFNSVIHERDDSDCDGPDNIYGADFQVIQDCSHSSVLRVHYFTLALIYMCTHNNILLRRKTAKQHESVIVLGEVKNSICGVYP